MSTDWFYGPSILIQGDWVVNGGWRVFMREGRGFCIESEIGFDIIQLREDHAKEVEVAYRERDYNEALHVAEGIIDKHIYDYSPRRFLSWQQSPVDFPTQKEIKVWDRKEAEAWGYADELDDDVPF